MSATLYYQKTKKTFDPRDVFRLSFYRWKRKVVVLLLMCNFLKVTIHFVRGLKILFLVFFHHRGLQQSAFSYVLLFFRWSVASLKFKMFPNELPPLSLSSKAPPLTPTAFWIQFHIWVLWWCDRNCVGHFACSVFIGRVPLPLPSSPSAFCVVGIARLATRDWHRTASLGCGCGGGAGQAALWLAWRSSFAFELQTGTPRLKLASNIVWKESLLWPEEFNFRARPIQSDNRLRRDIGGYLNFMLNFGIMQRFGWLFCRWLYSGNGPWGLNMNLHNFKYATISRNTARCMCDCACHCLDYKGGILPVQWSYNWLHETKTCVQISESNVQKFIITVHYSNSPFFQ